MMRKKAQQYVLGSKGFFSTEKDVFAFVTTKTSVDLFRTKKLLDGSFRVQSEGGECRGKEEDWINYYGFRFSSRQAAINHFIADATLSPDCQPPVFTSKEDQGMYDGRYRVQGTPASKKVHEVFENAQAKILSNALEKASREFRRDMRRARDQAKKEVANTIQGRRKK